MPFNATLTDRSTSLLSNRVLPWALAAVLALSLAVVVVVGHNGEPAPTRSIDTRPAVRVAKTIAAAGERQQRLSGVTRAVERADLAFLHAGHLAERSVRRGQQVAVGDVLAILHNPGLMPGVAAAEARVRELEQELEQLERETRRLADLHQRDLVPTEELERVESRRNVAREGLTQARVGLDEAREQLDEAFLRAPFNATVVELHVEPGQFVAPGQPVLSLSGRDQLEVALAVPGARLEGLELGQRVPVRDLETGHGGTGMIEQIGPAGPGHPAQVIIDLADADGIDAPGRAVQVDLNLHDRAGLKVPLAALVSPGTGDAHLFRVINERSIRVAVDAGRLDGDWVIVNGALAAGDPVVVAGHSQLLDNERVRVLP